MQLGDEYIVEEGSFTRLPPLERDSSAALSPLDVHSDELWFQTNGTHVPAIRGGTADPGRPA